MHSTKRCLPSSPGKQREPFELREPGRFRVAGPLLISSMQRDDFALGETGRQLAIGDGDRVRRYGNQLSIDDDLCRPVRADAAAGL